MGKWMVYMRGEAASNMFFRLIGAQDINAAIEIGQEIATRGKYKLIGITPWDDPDTGKTTVK